MPELTHDSSEDGFHEIQLSGKQLVFLLMSTTVVLVVTFLCGVLVGRNVRTAREAATPVDTPIVASSNEESGVPPVATGEPGAELQPGEFKAPRDLMRPNPVDEPTPKEQPPVTAQQPATASQVKTPPTPEVNTPPAPEVKTPPAKEKPAPPSKPDVPTAGRSGTWFLQVAALSTREAAAGTVRQLVAKGYPAYLDDSAPPLFRVRVGRYGTREEAARVAQKLQKEEQFKSDIRR